MRSASLALAAALALWLLGVGPLTALAPGLSRVQVVACAPAAGLLLLATVASYLVAAGAPIAAWARPTFAALALVSGWLLVRSARGRPPGADGPGAGRGWRLPAASCAVTAVLLLAPSIVGGRRFELLRGNGSDAFEACAAADLLASEGLAEALAEPAPALFVRSRTLPVAVAIVSNGRWANAAALAWLAELLGVRPVALEYAYSLACLLALHGVAHTALVRAGVGARRAAALAVAACCGTWPGLVLDLRAQSHLTVLPVVMLGLVAASCAGTRERALAGAAVGGVVLIYPELSPALGLGLALAAAAAWRAHGPPRRWAPWGWAALAALLVVGHQGAFLLRSLLAQASFATQRAGWPVYFARPLFEWPALGLAGLAPLADHPLLPAGRGPLVLLPLAVAVLLLTAVGAAAPLRRWSAALPGLAGGLTAATALQCAVIAYLGRFWALGKAITYLQPFATLALAAPLPGTAGLARRRGVTGAVVLAWAGAQLVVAADRVVTAGGRAEPRASVPHHGSHRAFDPDLGGVLEGIRRVRGPVALFTGDVWLDDYLALSAGPGADLVSADPVRLAPWRSVQACRRTLAFTHAVVRAAGATPAALARAAGRTAELAVVPVDAGPVWALERHVAVRRPEAPRSQVLHLLTPRAGALELQAVVRTPAGPTPTRLALRWLEGGPPGETSLAVRDGRLAQRLDAPAGFSQLELAPVGGALELDDLTLAVP